MTTRLLTAGTVRAVALVLALTTTMVCTLQTEARAGLAPAAIPSRVDSPSQGREADLKTVQKALESKIVRHRLRELGMDDQDIQRRLDHLSDAQVHQLASNVKALNPGGQAEIAGVLVLVLIVLLIIYLAKRI